MRICELWVDIYKIVKVVCVLFTCYKYSLQYYFILHDQEIKSNVSLCMHCYNREKKCILFFSNLNITL